MHTAVAVRSVSIELFGETGPLAADGVELLRSMDLLAVASPETEGGPEAVVLAAPDLLFRASFRW